MLPFVKNDYIPTCKFLSNLALILLGSMFLKEIRVVDFFIRKILAFCLGYSLGCPKNWSCGSWLFSVGVMFVVGEFQIRLFVFSCRLVEFSQFANAWSFHFFFG